MRDVKAALLEEFLQVIRGNDRISLRTEQLGDLKNLFSGGLADPDDVLNRGRPANALVIGSGFCNGLKHTFTGLLFCLVQLRKKLLRMQ